MTLKAFQPQRGKAYAIDVSAFGLMFPMFETARQNVELGSVVVVEIDGPLEQRASGCWDSYEAISARFDAALACEAARSVVLKISSPGGDAAGCVELARSMRQRAALANKPLYAWVGERACSAAYVLACAGQQILLSESAIVGSIGVIATREDVTAAHAARGVRVAFITSGARKTDGHPDAPITEAELVATQGVIDSFAGVLFELVKESRGVDAQPLEAAVFHGADAVSKKLANGLLPFEDLVQALTINQGLLAMENPGEAARKALEEMAAGEGPDAARAKRALAALDESDEKKSEDAPAEEPDGDEAKPAPKPDAEDEGDKESAEDEPADKEPKAAAKLADKGFQAFDKRLRALEQDKAAASARHDALERTQLLATRPDLDAATVKTLRDPKTPMAVVRSLIKSIPRSPSGASARDALAAAGATPTQGGDAGELSGPHLPPDHKRQMDEIMGLAQTKVGIINTPTRQVLGGRVE